MIKITHPNRDDQFLEAAKVYLLVQQEIIEHDEAARKAQDKKRGAEERLVVAKNKLAEFMGGNARLRNAVIGDKLVRVEFSIDQNAKKEKVEVSVEPIQVAR